MRNFERFTKFFWNYARFYPLIPIRGNRCNGNTEKTQLNIQLSRRVTRIDSKNRQTENPSRLLTLLLRIHQNDVQEILIEGSTHWTVDFEKLRQLQLIDRTSNATSATIGLTEEGERLCSRVLDEMSELLDGRSCNGHPTPIWNAHVRELTYNNVLVKRFRKAAPNQERILTRFQLAGWRIRIELPHLPRYSYQ